MKRGSGNLQREEIYHKIVDWLSENFGVKANWRNLPVSFSCPGIFVPHVRSMKNA